MATANSEGSKCEMDLGPAVGELGARPSHCWLSESGFFSNRNWVFVIKFLNRLTVWIITSSLPPPSDDSFNLSCKHLIETFSCRRVTERKHQGDFIMGQLLLWLVRGRAVTWSWFCSFKRKDNIYSCNKHFLKPWSCWDSVGHWGYLQLQFWRSHEVRG